MVQTRTHPPGGPENKTQPKAPLPQEGFGMSVGSCDQSEVRPGMFFFFSSILWKGAVPVRAWSGKCLGSSLTKTMGRALRMAVFSVAAVVGGLAFSVWTRHRRVLSAVCACAWLSAP